MDEKPTRIPSTEQMMRLDPEPVGVEFLAELPDHVRAVLRSVEDIGNKTGAQTCTKQ